MQGGFARPVTTSGMCCGRAPFTVHAARGSSSVVVEVLDVPENRQTDFWTCRHRDLARLGTDVDTGEMKEMQSCGAEMKYACGA